MEHVLVRVRFTALSLDLRLDQAPLEWILDSYIVKWFSDFKNYSYYSVIVG